MDDIEHLFVILIKTGNFIIQQVPDVLLTVFNNVYWCFAAIKTFLAALSRVNDFTLFGNVTCLVK